jgi:hypothetical protein
MNVWTCFAFILPPFHTSNPTRGRRPTDDVNPATGFGMRGVRISYSVRRVGGRERASRGARQSYLGGGRERQRRTCRLSPRRGPMRTGEWTRGSNGMVLTLQRARSSTWTSRYDHSALAGRLRLGWGIGTTARSEPPGRRPHPHTPAQPGTNGRRGPRSLHRSGLLFNMRSPCLLWGVENTGSASYDEFRGRLLSRDSFPAVCA